MSSNESYDCVIIGGGPAGATVATLLADFGHKVLLLEQSRFPRPHIGESLMPQTYWTFKRLGMLDVLNASDFPRKESVQFVSASGKESQPFYFTDRDPGPWSTTWQVPRDRFDKMMLDNARGHGAEIRQGVRVKRVLFDDTRAVAVRVTQDTDSPRRDRQGADAIVTPAHRHDRTTGATGAEPARDISAKVIVDATGQRALLARQLDLRYPDEKLKNASIYAYFRGAARDQGRNAGATIIITTPNRNGWFWFIPLDNDVTSVGLVAPPDYLFAGRGDAPIETLRAEIADCPGIARRLDRSECASEAFVTSDFSYRTRRIAGDGWVLVGDAFGFLDPIYSSGVMLALKSGEFAADAVHDAVESGDVSAARLGAFTPRLLAGMQYIRQLVHAFYDRDFSFGDFLRAHPRYHDPLVRVLIGDVFDGGLQEMFDVIARSVDLPGPVRLEGNTLAP